MPKITICRCWPPRFRMRLTVEPTSFKTMKVNGESLGNGPDIWQQWLRSFGSSMSIDFLIYSLDLLIFSHLFVGTFHPLNPKPEVTPAVKELSSSPRESQTHHATRITSMGSACYREVPWVKIEIASKLQENDGCWWFLWMFKARNAMEKFLLLIHRDPQPFPGNSSKISLFRTGKRSPAQPQKKTVDGDDLRSLFETQFRLGVSRMVKIKPAINVQMVDFAKNSRSTI